MPDSRNSRRNRRQRARNWTPGDDLPYAPDERQLRQDRLFGQGIVRTSVRPRQEKVIPPHQCHSGNGSQTPWVCCVCGHRIRYPQGRV